MKIDYEKFLKTGLKEYAFGEKIVKASHAIVAVYEDDFEKIKTVFENELNDKVIAWCYVQQNVRFNTTKILLVTKEFSLIQTVDKLLSREGEVIPAVMKLLSFRNDGTITKKLIEKQLRISTMESCTSGLIASNITDVEGASEILKGAYVTYSNTAKLMAGVSDLVIDSFGIYSLETAVEMAFRVREQFDSNIGIGITGSFGNVDPANTDSVAGVVYYQILLNNIGTPVKLIWNNLELSRKEMKQKTVDIVLATLNAMLWD